MAARGRLYTSSGAKRAADESWRIVRRLDLVQEPR
jgi:hypothetical protein